jgi:modified peptide precursor CbpA
MAKGFGRSQLWPAEALFVWAEPAGLNERGRIMKKSAKSKRPAVIASRKACRTSGTGLSHYILMDKRAKK